MTGDVRPQVLSLDNQGRSVPIPTSARTREQNMYKVIGAALIAMTITVPAIAGKPPLVGNAACWGDNSRQDISCRELTESFLMSMKDKSMSQVQEAMGVKGRPVDNGLHFISNYAKGEKNGSGDINFVFNDGRVTVMFGSLDLPNASGDAEFIWNVTLLPNGCSDLPHSKLTPCDGKSDDLQHQQWLLRASGASQQDVDAATALAHKLSGQ
jgi:hypothetical protein